MRAICYMSTLVSVVLGCAWALPVAAQSAGPVEFKVTESALTGTVSCNGGPATAITPVDASTTDVTGSNDAQASNLSAQACGLPLYSIASADDSTGAQDQPGANNGGGSSDLENVSLLGGLVTYRSKLESHSCTAATGSILTINCTDITTLDDLIFAGNLIVGPLDLPVTISESDIVVQIPGYCTGVAVFNGSLTLFSLSTQEDPEKNARSVNVSPIELDGTLTCLGLPLASMEVHLKDALVYQDLLSGDELLSDSFPYKEIENGVLWKVEGKWTVK